MDNDIREKLKEIITSKSALTIDEYKNKWHEIEIAEEDILPKLDELERSPNYYTIENI